MAYFGVKPWKTCGLTCVAAAGGGAAGPGAPGTGTGVGFGPGTGIVVETGGAPGVGVRGGPPHGPSGIVGRVPTFSAGSLTFGV
jgi:hypothetical protein